MLAIVPRRRRSPPTYLLLYLELTRRNNRERNCRATRFIAERGNKRAPLIAPLKRLAFSLDNSDYLRRRSQRARLHTASDCRNGADLRKLLRRTGISRPSIYSGRDADYEADRGVAAERKLEKHHWDLHALMKRATLSEKEKERGRENSI